MHPCYDANELITFATTLLIRGGLNPDQSKDVAEILVEGDLLGHTTHGLALLAPYLADLEKGGMTRSGEPRVLADFPAAISWDGMLLPGPWLVRRAIDVAITRAKVNGTCSVVIRRSHHIACLEAYLKPVADAGFVILMMCSDPNCKGVAPHGGRKDVYTPNPIAAAWPTLAAPVLIDTSMSITSLGTAKRMATEGKKFPANWAIDANGVPTNDPAALYTDPPGALLPVGGVDHGYKGYALGLIVEALTSGLCGFGRADGGSGWSANVFQQIIDPALFGGREAFARESEWLANACRATPPRDAAEPVRLPGEAALRRREGQLQNGVSLYPGVMPALGLWMQKFGVTAPTGH